MCNIHAKNTLDNLLSNLIFLQPLELIKGAGTAVRQLHEWGFRVAVISTQSCVGEGFVTEDMMQAVMDKVSGVICSSLL